MINSSIIFIGLDTHKEFVEVAYTEDKRKASVIHLGRIPSSKLALKSSLGRYSPDTLITEGCLSLLIATQHRINVVTVLLLYSYSIVGGATRRDCSRLVRRTAQSAIVTPYDHHSATPANSFLYTVYFRGCNINAGLQRYLSQSVLVLPPSFG